ncbi:MAG: chaperone ProQ [Gammaproteobacteria bacterium]|nr:chaperone ProQ [Gammaproteobacteria bacterium]
MNTSRHKKQVTLAELKSMLQSDSPKAEPKKTGLAKKAASVKAKKADKPESKPVEISHETEVQQEAAARRQQRYQEARLLLEFLCETYPNCFNFKFRKPLKVGIDKDISAKHPDKTSNRAVLANALKIYTLNIRYWKAIISQENRVNLEGEVDGVVTEEQKLHASGPYQKALSALTERQAKLRNHSKKPKPSKIKA